MDERPGQPSMKGPEEITIEQNMWVRVGRVLCEITPVHSAQKPHPILRWEVSEKGVRDLHAIVDDLFEKMRVELEATRELANPDG